MLPSCKLYKAQGWATDFRYALDKERYKGKGSGGGWASNFESPFSKNRFGKSDGWASGGVSHYNIDKNCKNKGWSVDFRSSLSSNRYNSLNSSFFVLSAPKFAPLKFHDSFGTSGKSKEGGFAFNKKNKSVKEKKSFRFKSKPRTNDSFGPNVVKKDYKDNVYNKKKKRVTKTKGLFKKKKEKPYKRRKDMELDLFQFKS